ncbi:unnamed protein product [Rotaria sordida]|uniref:Uncharacterized protein n=1 Tax=Rotaria sordida TaxID=392033 RepID=A0A814YIN7_9BILA|nr:unnamed protein product [Rotaria sordida]
MQFIHYLRSKIIGLKTNLMSSTQLFILLILLNIVCGIYNPSNFKKKFNQSPASYISENNNRYVWFTRSIDSKIKDEANEKEEICKKNSNQFFSRKKFNVFPT